MHCDVIRFRFLCLVSFLHLSHFFFILMKTGQIPCSTQLKCNTWRYVNSILFTKHIWFENKHAELEWEKKSQHIQRDEKSGEREFETKFNYHSQREVQHIKLTSSIRLTAERETASVIDSTQFQPISSRRSWRSSSFTSSARSLRCNEKMFAYFRHTT